MTTHARILTSARRATSRTGVMPRFRGGSALLVFAAVSVALMTAYAIAALRVHADEHRDAEVLLGEAAAATSRQQALVWQAAAGDPADTQEGIDRIGREIGLRLDQLATIDRGGSSLLLLYESFEDYGEAVEAVLGSLGTVAPEARRPHLEAVSPAFEAFSETLRAAGEVYRAGAVATGNLANLGTATTLVSSAVLLALLFQRAARARRDAAVLAGEQRALRASEDRFQSLMQHSSDAVTVIGLDGVVRYQSESLRRLLGRGADEVLGGALSDLLHPNDAAILDAVLGQARERRLSSHAVEWRMARDDGLWAEIETVVTDMTQDPHVGGLLLNSRDVSERAALEAQLAHQAYHDALTGLPNRVRFAEALSAALARAGRREAEIAVLLLDLDDFKTINDSLGHGAGDELLREVARRLEASIRPGDMAARLAGDEFAVLLEAGSGSAEDAARVAERIARRLRIPFGVHGRTVATSASIGIVTASDAATADDTIRNADVAMYRAKAAGGATYAVFEPTMHAAAVARLELEADLQGALGHGELSVVYQPIVSLADGTPWAAEALLRWNHPGRGLIGPAEFVPVAEQMGLIGEIGWWVLQTAVRQVVAWRKASGRGDAGSPSVSVNLSVRQLQDVGLPERLERMVRGAGAEPASIVLELTEGAIGADTSVTSRLADLRQRGFVVAIDDFGTGYSTLSRLQRLPVDIVKIDRSFIEDLEIGDEPTLIRAMIQLARGLGLRTIAEGVETEAQRELLLALGCDSAQGHLLGGPATPNVIFAGAPLTSEPAKRPIA